MAFLELQGLSKQFGGLTAVSELDLAVSAGEIRGLIGPNGAGKTTAMRLLATDIVADGGEIEVLEHALPRQADAVRPRLGFMPDSVGLYDALTLV